MHKNTDLIFNPIGRGDPSYNKKHIYKIASVWFKEYFNTML